MGYEFEVWAWTKVGVDMEDSTPVYEYILKYQGDSFTEAMQNMQSLKAEGVGCVKLLWR